MRSIAYIMLHYGKDYLQYTIQSVHDVVDKVIIIYSSIPTHHQSDMPCPDSREELVTICRSFPKVQFVDITGEVIMKKKHGGSISENWHLNHAFRYSDKYDVMLRLDSDEVWEPSQVEDAIRQASGIKAKYIGIDGFIHFWRSFNWMNVDGFRPVRLHNLRAEGATNECVKSTIYHFGYAIKEEMMNYKWSCHGHHTEEKQGWRNKWKKWEPGCSCEYLHPVTDAYWHRAEWFDKNKLPEMLKSHPYFNLEII